MSRSQSLCFLRLLRVAATPLPLEECMMVLREGPKKKAPIVRLQIPRHFSWRFNTPATINNNKTTEFKNSKRQRQPKRLQMVGSQPPPSPIQNRVRVYGYRPRRVLDMPDLHIKEAYLDSFFVALVKLDWNNFIYSKEKPIFQLRNCRSRVDATWKPTKPRREVCTYSALLRFNLSKMA